MPVSKEDKAIYAQKRKAFLAENKWCVVARKVRGEQVSATHVHHRKGRGKYYLDESTFVATTKEGDTWIHKNPEKAKKLGLLE